jgi:Family of unknown function (DUF6879)
MHLTQLDACWSIKLAAARNPEGLLVCDSNYLGSTQAIPVRIVSEPHSDYTRFGLDLGRVNAAAGEDIRYLPRERVKGVDLPDHDFWLTDSSRLAILRFGEDDVLLGAEVPTDPAVIVQHCYWRDVAWHYAIPLMDYNK